MQKVEFAWVNYPDLPLSINLPASRVCVPLIISVLESRYEDCQ